MPMASLISPLPGDSANFPFIYRESESLGTDSYVEEAILRAEVGRKTWLALAVMVLATVAALALAGG